MIRRKLFEELKAHLQAPEISLLVGPRQVGKTTLMLHLQECLEKQGHKTLFLSLDFEKDWPLFSSQETFLKKLELEFGQEKGFVFIDEIQRRENAGLFLKGLYDRRLPYKFIVSGSGSLELKEKIHESLVGRKRLFELNPVSLEEFLNYRTGYRYEGRLSLFCELHPDEAAALLQEYLNFGGYPRVITATTQQEKRWTIGEIFNGYLERDVSYLIRSDRVGIFRDLIRLLAAQIGSLINYSELSNTLGLSLATSKNYLWYAEKTFILRRITPFFRNIRKEISRAPVCYFYDLGLRNYAVGLFGQLEHPQERGFVFENLVFNILCEKLRYTGASIHFWRTKEGAEVDFVVNFVREIIPIEVKFQKFRAPKISRALRSFIRKYQPSQAFVINQNLKASLEIDKTVVFFRPIWDFALSPAFLES